MVWCSVFAAMAGPTNTVSEPASIPSRPVPKFADVVNRCFSQWDLNGDGTLSPNEINSAVVNPAFHDEAAAAIAAVKVVVRGDKYNLPAITQAYLVSSPLREPSVTNELTDLPAGPTSKKLDHPPAFQPRYRACLARLHRAAHELFPQSAPVLAACHQGPLGDCYLISVVGAMVDRDPARVQSFFAANADGSTRVAFANEHNVNVPPLTDAEIAISSSAGTNGLWLAVLENAFGKIVDKASVDNTNDKPDTDAIAHGGKPRTVINLLDGRQTRSFNLTQHRNPQRDPQFADTLGKAIAEALSDRQLVATVTPTNTPTAPGVNAKHAYAILNYNPDSKVAHVWNPHGNRFQPKGPDSRENGYTTRNGEFDIPLADLIQVFSAVIIETRAPFQPK